jgi:catechol 2,3-dioxygenase-like lactoylglutathione lyase family enzyme
MAKLKHIAIASQDPEATANFYRDVFDLKIVGKTNGDNAEGYYLSDGNINLAVLKFKNDQIAGDSGMSYSGIHHIGFQVDDPADADARLKKADSHPMDEVNAALHTGNGKGNGGLNVERKYDGPDGVMIDISQGGWVGTDQE